MGNMYYYKDFASLNMYVTQQLRLIRESRHIKQETIAQALGITRQAYGKLESNQTRMNLDTIERLCAILEINIAALLPLYHSSQPAITSVSLNNVSREHSTQTPIADTISTQNILKLIYGYAAMPPDEQLMLLDYIEHFLK